MVSKSQKTKTFIIETVAPIFNKNGYSGMSLSKIAEATKLTKGAIYGNFSSKEELALEVLRYAVRRVLKDLNRHVLMGNTSIEKLLNIASFYNKYYEYSMKFGGCPILNIGVDSNNQNEALTAVVRSYNQRILEKFAELIAKGKERGEIKKEVEEMVYAKRFFYMIEGAVYMSYIMRDNSFLRDVSATITTMIQRELRK